MAARILYSTQVSCVPIVFRHIPTASNYIIHHNIWFHVLWWSSWETWFFRDSFPDLKVGVILHDYSISNFSSCIPLSGHLEGRTNTLNLFVHRKTTASRCTHQHSLLIKGYNMALETRRRRGWSFGQPCQEIAETIFAAVGSVSLCSTFRKRY